MPDVFDYILIDLNNLFARNYAIHEKETYENENEVLSAGGILGTLNSIKKLIRENGSEDTVVYLLADNPTSKVFSRKMISPDYKINRIEKPKMYYRGLEVLSLILQSYSDNFYFMQVPNLEADDLVPVIIDQLEKDKSILLVSSDMDWARAIGLHGYNAVWHNGKSIVTKGDFFDKYGFDPSEANVINYKTYRGDSSDNIEAGVPRIQEKLIFKLMEYGDVEDVITNIDTLEFVPPQWKEAIKERVPRLRLNKQLVSFSDVAYSEVRQFLIKCKLRHQTLKMLYEGLGIDPAMYDRRVSDYVASTNNEKPNKFFTRPRIKRV
jgi:hypothetical protein